MSKSTYVKLHMSPCDGPHISSISIDAFLKMADTIIQKYDGSVQMLLPDQSANEITSEQQRFRKLAGIAKKGRKMDVGLRHEDKEVFNALERWLFSNAKNDFSVEYGKSVSSDNRVMETLDVRMTREGSDIMLHGRKIFGMWECSVKRQTPSLYVQERQTK